jgi:hypothetical protein
MADNFVTSTQGASFPKPAIKLYLYKISRTHPLWDFNHNFGKITNMPGYVATGGDPADLDIPSNLMSARLKGAATVRMPFDSWILRKTDQQIDLFTGSPKNAGNLNNPEVKKYFELEDIDRDAMKLSWKNLYGKSSSGDSTAQGKKNTPKTYKEDFAAFFADRKKLLVDNMKLLMADFEKDKRTAIDRYDLTTFVIKYDHDSAVADIANTLSMDLASDPNAFFAAGAALRLETATSLGEFHSSESGSGSSVVGDVSDINIPLIEENDILELRVKYLGTDSSQWEVQESGFVDKDGFQRVFMGYVTAMVRTMQYGNQEKVSIAAAGVSKLFSTYDTSFTPTVAEKSIFEQGAEMSDIRFSIWSNNFNGKGTDDIFDYFMRSGLFCNKLGDAKGELPKKEAELSAAKQGIDLMAQNKKTTNNVDNPQTPEGQVDFAKRVKDLTNEINGLTTTIANKKRMDMAKVLKASDFPGQATTAAAPPKELDMEYYLPIDMRDAAATSFQLINYIPMLMNLARKYALDDAKIDTATVVDERTELLSSVIATTEQAGYIGYKAMMQTAFKLFYPELKRPDAIFNDIKQNTFLELFEDRPGVIRLRPPKYNIINLNAEISEYIHAKETKTPVVNLPSTVGKSELDVALNAEYVIPASAITSIAVHRDDMAMVTRADHTWETPFSGQALDGYTGHFTDPGYLMKYGLRTTGPQHSPMAISPQIAEVLSAVRVATANATARTIKLTLFNTREYRLGRLYYIPISLPTAQEAALSGIVSKGVVGYVTKVTTSLSYGQEASHTLSLEHVRQAEVLRVPLAGGKTVYYANFKKLPDIATYMRLIASDKGFGSDAASAIQKLGTNTRDAVADNATAQVDGFLVVSNGMTNSAFNRDITSPVYADKLRGSGITVNVKAGDTNLDFEQDNFVTTIAADSIADGSRAAMSKNLLAKLAIYDVDPLLKLYPTISSPTATTTVVAGIGHESYSTTVATALIPNTESVQNRDIDDLMWVIFNMLVATVNSKCFGGGWFDAAKSTGPIPQSSPDGRLKYIVTPAQDGSDLYAPPGQTVPIKRRIFVGTQVVGTDYPSRVIFAFVQTQDINKVTGNPDYNKFFVFHVPYSKSLRLSSIMHEGACVGGGYRTLQTVKALAKNPKVKSDFHSDGNALIFTNLGTALWSFDDIVKSCVELNMAAPSGNNSSGIPGVPSEANSDTLHLFNSYINCMIEPFNYVAVPRRNASYNATGLAGMQGQLNAAGATKLMKKCLAAAGNYLGISFATEQVAEVYRPNDAKMVQNYFKFEFQRYIANIKHLLFVPTKTSFFCTGSAGGPGLFDKLAVQNQAFPRYNSTSTELATTTTTGDQKSLFLAVMQEFSTSLTGSVQAIAPVTGANHYLLLSQPDLYSRPDLRPAGAPDPYADISNFTVNFNTGLHPIVPSTRNSLEGFIMGARPDYRLLCFQLIDNLALMPAPAGKGSGYILENRVHMQGNAVSNIWHTSYAQSTETFQARVLVSKRLPVDEQGKLNLIGLTE